MIYPYAEKYLHITITCAVTYLMNEFHCVYGWEQEINSDYGAKYLIGLENNSRLEFNLVKSAE